MLTAIFVFLAIVLIHGAYRAGLDNDILKSQNDPIPVSITTIPCIRYKARITNYDIPSETVRHFLAGEMLQAVADNMRVKKLEYESFEETQRNYGRQIIVYEGEIMLAAIAGQFGRNN